MASNPDDDLIRSERFIKHRYLQIPKDQQKFLDDDSSWSKHLKQGQYGMLNLPSQVLQEVKNSAISKHVEPSQEDHTPSPPSRAADNARFASQSPTQGHAASSPVNDDDGDDESDGVPLCSWPETQLSAEDAAAATQASISKAEMQAPSPEKRHETPLRSTEPKRKPHLSFIEEDPTSSAMNSDGLEIEPREFLSQSMELPVNRAALRAVATGSGRPEPTPPSAQAPPRTTERAMHPPPPKRRRRLEEIQSSETGPEASQSAVVPSARTSLPPQEPESNQNSMATGASTNTYESRRTPQRSLHTGSPRMRYGGPATSTATHQDPSGFTPTWEGRRMASAASSAVNTGASTSKPLFAPPLAQHIAEHRESSPSSSPATRQAQLPAKEGQPARTPYEEFKAAYADYSENSRKFVSACLSVNQLRRDRQLPEFLYDDYVRAHSSEYLIYVSECDRKKAERILPAIQWYNETTKEMQYTKRLIRKDNLAAILEAHAGEARSVRRSLGDSQSTTSESAAEESDEDMSDAPEGNEEEEGQEPEAIEMKDAGESRSSPQLHIESPGPPPIQAFSGSRRGKKAAENDHDLSATRSLSANDQTTNQRDEDIEDNSHVEEVAVDGLPPVAADDETRNAPSSPSTEPSEPERIPSTPQASSIIKKENTTPAWRRLYAARQSTARDPRGSFDTVDFLMPLPPSPSVYSQNVRSPAPHYERVPETPAITRPNHEPRSSAQSRYQPSSVGVDNAAEEAATERAAPRTLSPLQEKVVQESSTPRSRPDRDDDDDDDDDDDESEDDAFETAPQELMPPPPAAKEAARNSPMSRLPPSPPAPPPPPAAAAAAAAARVNYNSTAPPAVGFSRARSSLTMTSTAVPRTANASSVRAGGSHSPTSSDRSYTSTSRSSRRIGESAADRSRNLKEFLLKRRTAGTLSSTLASRK